MFILFRHNVHAALTHINISLEAQCLPS